MSASSLASASASPGAAAADASVNKHNSINNSAEKEAGTNFVKAGIEANRALFTLIILAPFLSLLFAYATSSEMEYNHPSMITNPITEMLPSCLRDIRSCGSSVLQAGWSVMVWDTEAVRFILGFMIVALILDTCLPGSIETGPETATGHIPHYVDNGLKHCILYTLLFYVGSNLGFFNLYDFGIFYDTFCGSIAFLNVFGLIFCIFLMIKGLYFPSTSDSGTTGSLFKDFVWGTELYPRIGRLDLKRFINCRFSMTYWQLAGLSFFYRSYTLHNNDGDDDDATIDWGMLFTALSQYLYLLKFFLWEMGYMRSIDIIVDRAGFEIQWGCLVWVPSVYSLHTRFLVQHPSRLGFVPALALFILSMTGVVLNYMADRERDVFRASNGKCKIWGKEPRYITAEYEVIDCQTGKTTVKKSLLLASGFWGVARHFQYFFELTAAWCWCLLANPFVNGVLPLFYAAFLTYLLIDRAERDSDKCRLKYGVYYEEYCKLVPYKILPGVY